MPFAKLTDLNRNLLLAAGLAIGWIVLIIILVLIVILSVVLIVVARRTGRWCFAGQFIFI